MNILNALQGMGPALLDAVGQGVLWGIMVLGVYITYKLLDIADLTVDGSFALGGCVCAMLILNKSMTARWRFRILQGSPAGGPGSGDPGRYGSRICYRHPAHRV